ncbi:MAG: nodulation protein NfeD [Acidobacteriota bacterium]
MTNLTKAFRLLATTLLLLSPVAGFADVLRIVVDDTIHPASQEFISRSIDEAGRKPYQALLIELRTPGGLESSTRKIVNAITASRVPVIVWVTPSGSRAASAGFFILESADIAAMAPGTNTGASHPVLLGQKPDDVMRQKMENDSAAFMRSVATHRGRNVKVAESAVLQSKSFTDEEALQLGLINIVARDQRDLFQQISAKPVTRFNGDKQQLVLNSARVVTSEMTMREQVLSFLMDPNVAFVLLALGILGLWAEFNHPGAVLPGVVGGLSIILAIFALNILPTRYAAFALILLAFILFVLEGFITSHGVLGAGGVVAMFFGGLLLVNGPIPEMRVHWITALSVSIPFGIIAVFLVTLIVRSHGRQVVTGMQGMIGEIGIAETALTPGGRIFVHGETWSALSPVNVAVGESVVVRAINGLELKVEPVAVPSQIAGTGSPNGPGLEDSAPT